MFVSSGGAVSDVDGVFDIEREFIIYGKSDVRGISDDEMLHIHWFLLSAAMKNNSWLTC